MRAVNFFVPEMALISSGDVIPGLEKSRMPRLPFNMGVAVNPSVRKTLFLYRFKMILTKVTEDQILQELKPYFIKNYKLTNLDSS